MSQPRSSNPYLSTGSTATCQHLNCSGNREADSRKTSEPTRGLQRLDPKWLRSRDLRHQHLGFRGAAPGSGTREMVPRRMVPKDKCQLLMIFGVETASCLRETHHERWGALPSTFPDGSPRRQDALSISQIISIWLSSFGTIRSGTILRVPDGTRRALSSALGPRSTRDPEAGVLGRGPGPGGR